MRTTHTTQFTSTIIFALLCIMSSSIQAQTSSHPWAGGLGINMMDYNSPQGGKFFQPDNMDPGLYLSVNRYFSTAFSMTADLTIAQGVRFPAFNPQRFRPSLFDMSYRLNFKFNNGTILKESAFIAPFLTLGFGGSYVKQHPDLYVPMVGGLNFRLSEHIQMQMQVIAKKSLNKDYQHLSQAVAFIYNLGGSEDEKQKPLPNMEEEDYLASIIPSDSDGDGIIDQHDACPDMYGEAAFEGCPADERNASPRPTAKAYVASSDTEIKLSQSKSVSKPITHKKAQQLAGIQTQKQNSLTSPKSQKLGEQVSFTDAMASAKAPQAHEQFSLTKANIQKPESISSPPSLVRVQTDRPCNDVISSDLDTDPIYFASNEEVLSQETRNTLDKVASILHSCSKAQLVVKGHADTDGANRNNLVLSIKRAFNVKYYLVYKHGISQTRIASAGFGESNPTASNVTSNGRQLNRRVDFELHF